jgi:hypothetical protein
MTLSTPRIQLLRPHLVCEMSIPLRNIIVIIENKREWNRMFIPIIENKITIILKKKLKKKLKLYKKKKMKTSVWSIGVYKRLWLAGIG